jgi:glutathione S-transferase
MEPVRLLAIPMACSVASHIALREGGVPHSITWFGLRSKHDEDGTDLRTLAPKGKVAALVLPDGEMVTENVAVLTCIADLAGEGVLAPPRADTRARMRLLEWLSFVATEVHKQVLAPYYDAQSPEETKRDVIARLLPAVLRHPEAALEHRTHLLGDQVSVADFYLLWALVLVPHMGATLDAFPALVRFRDHMLQREAVAAALVRERRAWQAAAEGAVR